MLKKICLSFFVIISSILFAKVTNASTASDQALSHGQAIDLALKQSQETQNNLAKKSSLTTNNPSTVKSNDLFASEANDPKDKKAAQQVSENKIEIPDWVKRTNFAIEAGTDQKTDYFFETVQPLLGTQDKDVVFFNQSRISETAARPTYNIGFGLRKIFAESYLLGINSFYDYQDLHRHSRGGVGFEAISDRGLEGRINTYIGISGRRLVQEDASNQYYEKVANGFDWELGGPVPYLSFLKVYGGGNWYNFEHFNNKLGWQARMEYTPVKYTRLDFTVLHDNKTRDIDFRFEGALTLAFTSFSLHDIISDIKGSPAAYPKINLRDKVLDRVVRDFDITVIKSIKSKSSGLTIEGGRK